MAKKIFSVLFFLLATVCLCACGSLGSEEEEEELPLPIVSASVAVSPEESKSLSPSPSETSAPLYVSRTTGLPYTEEPLYHPMMVIIENSSYARPQTGLMQADVIYEAPVEATITRFICLFNDTLPTVAGPVRSARIYLLHIQKEWDAVLIHFGGANTPGVESYVYGSNTSYIKVRVDGLKGKYDKYFWRSTDRSAPHNVYTDLPYIEEKLYDYTPNERAGWLFSADAGATGEPVRRVGIPYLTSNTSNVEFVYDEEQNRFCRYENGEPFMTYTVTENADGTQSTATEQVCVRNLIVQYAKSYLIPDDGGRRMVVLTGTGRCEYFINGRHQSGYWERDSLDDPTIYYTDNGEEVVFSPGNTWVALQPDSKEIEIEYAGLF